MAGQLNIDGFLKDLGITEKTPGFKQLYEATQKVMAHAGGTGGVKIPPKFALLSPEKALNASLPILEVERAQSQGGRILTNVMRNWSNRIKEGGGEVTEEAINKLTRLTNRLGKTLIGTTDGKPNLSFEQFDEKGRLARNVVLEQLAEIEKDAVSSGLMDSAIDAAEAAAEQKRYESMAGPLKIIRQGVDKTKDIVDANPLLKRGIKIAGAAGTQLVTNVSKATAGIDPLMIGTGIKGVITKADLPSKILSAKDALEGTLGTAAWSSRLRPKVGTPAALLAIGSAVGEMQAGGAKWMRELGVHNKAGTFGTATGFTKNPFMSTAQQNKINGISLNDVKIEKEEENPLTIANNYEDN